VGRNAALRLAPVLAPQASDVGTAYAATPLAFAGTVRGISAQPDKRARLALGDVTERLSVQIQGNLYAGSGGLEGGPEMEGRPKPLLFGRCYNFAPVALGNVDLGLGSLPTYQFHYRAATLVEAVRVRGVAQASTGGTPGVGQYRAFLSQGLVQLGSSPDGDVTVDAQGDAFGGYVNTTGTILRRLLQDFGPQYPDSVFDGAAWALAEFDLPGEVGIWIADPETAAQAAETLLQGCGGVLAGGRAGTLRLFDPIATDAPQFTLGVETLLDCVAVPMPAALRPLPAAIRVDWARNWSPVPAPAGSVAAADRERLSATDPSYATAQCGDTQRRVAQQRPIRLPGLYYAQSDALARATKMAAWVDTGPVAVTVTTDRYLGQVDLGCIGRVVYPAHGLDGGMTGCVVGWREVLAGRRLEITIVGAPS
jgi:hypothetical protein